MSIKVMTRVWTHSTRKDVEAWLEAPPRMISDLLYGEHCRGCNRALCETFATRLGPIQKGGRTFYGVRCRCGIINLMLFSEDIPNHVESAS